VSIATQAEVLGLKLDGGVATLTLNRPEARNALNMELKRELARVLRAIPEDRSIRCVLLTGNGPAFSAGGDVKELDASRTALTSRDRMDWLLHEVFLPLAHLPVPTVAAVNGAAFGAGFSLALACDIVVASEEAVFSLAFARMGLVPDCGALWFLPRVLGAGRAKELLFTARRFGAAEALELGIAQRVAPAAELAGISGELARSIAAGPSHALRMTKRLLEQCATSTLEEAAQLESYAQGIAMSSPEHAEALEAFRERREPDFPCVS
jgi:2-(1,2-epoxy-1,2-dihydrophenyl)acetyl-CoA isomerase